MTDSYLRGGGGEQRGGGGQLSPVAPPGLVHVSSRRGWGAAGVGPGGLSGYRMEIKLLPAVVVSVHLNIYFTHGDNVMVHSSAVGFIVFNVIYTAS